MLQKKMTHLHLTLIIQYVFLLAHNSLCLNRSHNLQIIGGKPVKNDVMHAVAITVDSKVICSGGILNDNYVLTAAQCFHDVHIGFVHRRYVVMAGRFDVFKKRSHGLDIPVQTVYVLKSYDLVSKVDDIAVLHLERSLHVSRNKYLKRLKLPKENTVLTASSESRTASGFGASVIELSTNPITQEPLKCVKTIGVVRFLTCSIISKEECEYILVNEQIPDTRMCCRALQDSHGVVTGICDGDIGAPLMSEDGTVIGVVHGNPFDCNESLRPAVYTRVDLKKYLDFINNAMNQITDTNTNTFP